MIVRALAALVCGTAAWFAVDFINDAPPHLLWHFWDQRSLGGYLVMVLTVLSWELAKPVINWLAR